MYHAVFPGDTVRNRGFGTLVAAESIEKNRTRKGYEKSHEELQIRNGCLSR